MMKIVIVWLRLSLAWEARDQAHHLGSSGQGGSTLKEKKSIQGHLMPQWCVCVAMTAKAIQTTSTRKLYNARGCPLDERLTNKRHRL